MSPNVFDDSNYNLSHIVFTCGVWDLFHIGHLNLLEKAKSAGSFLIVGVVEDEAVRRLKGIDRPIINQYNRAKIVDSLKCVDRVVFSNSFNTDDCIKKLVEFDKLNVKTVVIGDDQKHLSFDYAKQTGIQFLKLARTEGVSTSEIAERIKNVSNK